MISYMKPGQGYPLVTKILSVLLVLSMLVFVRPQSAQAACALKYTVQSGDTLFKIAATYQVDFKALAEANSLKEPYLIFVGQVLCIPPGAEIPETTQAASGTPSAKKGPLMATLHLGTVAWVGVSNFNKDRFYYVKVYGGGWNYWKYPEYQIGYIRTDSKGQFGSWFHMPYEFQELRTVTFCVKDVINDDVIGCKITTDNDYYDGRWKTGK